MKRAPPPPTLPLNRSLNQDNRFTPSPPTSHSSQSTSDRESSSASDSTLDDDLDQQGSTEVELETLERIRQNIQKNLLLRPLASAADGKTESLDSPGPLTGSIYYTPVEEEFDLQAYERDSPLHSPRHYPHTASGDVHLQPQFPSVAPVSSAVAAPTPHSAPVQLQRPARALLPAKLAILLSSPQIPLVIDCRLASEFSQRHIRNSVSLSLPLLILKRFRKHGLPDLDALKPFLSDENSRDVWSTVMSDDRWSGHVVIFDETMDPALKDDKSCIPWALVPILTPLLIRRDGAVNYLKGGFATFATSHSRHLTGSGDGSTPHSVGLYQLDTNAAAKAQPLPVIDRPPSPPKWLNTSDSIGSPPPSALAYGMQNPGRRPSVPNLRKLDTKSTEKLQTNLKPKSSKGNLNMPTLQIGTPLQTDVPPTPALPGAWPLSAAPVHQEASSSSYSRPRSPKTPKAPATPLTARPDANFKTSLPFSSQPVEDQTGPTAIISAILPNFLFLGPEITTQEHVDELRAVGIKRVINIAAECGADDHGLQLRSAFDKYFHIPMRDAIEEEGITRGVRIACEIIDDARLHSAPVYVHCKAGRSRSVTAVIAYLIHANHWTLSQAYSFVLERRTGISPNIGFVSELMTFEEQELGGKSVGVVQSPPQSGNEYDQTPHAVQTSRRPTLANHSHARDSLPPFATSMSFEAGPMSAGGAAARGDAGQEMEIRDAAGRYRHARRAPVDETTLQPLRRVSKAGLESSLEGMF